jgi:hypothetical protein
MSSNRIPSRFEHDDQPDTIDDHFISIISSQSENGEFDAEFQEVSVSDSPKHSQQHALVDNAHSMASDHAATSSAANPLPVATPKTLKEKKISFSLDLSLLNGDLPDTKNKRPDSPRPATANEFKIEKKKSSTSAYILREIPENSTLNQSLEMTTHATTNAPTVEDSWPLPPGIEITKEPFVIPQTHTAPPAKSKGCMGSLGLCISSLFSPKRDTNAPLAIEPEASAPRFGKQKQH